MVTRKLFLASSSELAEDRRAFELFISRKNKEYVAQGTFLHLVVWEDFLDAMSRTRLQAEYNQAIADCDIFIALFGTRLVATPKKSSTTLWPVSASPASP